MSVVEDGIGILRAAGVSPQQQRFMVRAAWVFIVTFHIAWVCGWLSFFGLAAPFAEAQTVKQVAADNTAKVAQLSAQIQELTASVTAGRIEQIQQQIDTQKQLECHYEKTKNWDAAGLSQQNVRWLVGRYRALAHGEPELPVCDNG